MRPRPRTLKRMSRPTGRPPAQNVILLGQALVGPGEDVDMTITIDTTELGVGAATVLLGVNLVIGNTVTDNVALTDPTNPVSGAAVLYIGNAADAPLLHDARNERGEHGRHTEEPRDDHDVVGHATR